MTKTKMRLNFTRAINEIKARQGVLPKEVKKDNCEGIPHLRGEDIHIVPNIFGTVKRRRKSIGEKIREARIGKGISQMDMAFDLNMQQNHISRIEAGKVKPREDTVYKILDYLSNVN